MEHHRLQLHSALYRTSPRTWSAFSITLVPGQSLSAVYHSARWEQTVHRVGHLKVVGEGAAKPCSNRTSQSSHRACKVAARVISFRWAVLGSPPRSRAILQTVRRIWRKGTWPRLTSAYRIAACTVRQRPAPLSVSVVSPWLTLVRALVVTLPIRPFWSFKPFRTSRGLAEAA